MNIDMQRETIGVRSALSARKKYAASSIYQFLQDHAAAYRTYERQPLYTVEDADALNLPEPEARTKNLFLRDKKKKNYYLLTVREHLPVQIKAFQQKIGAKPLSFASEEDLYEILGLRKGSVTPFGLLNDTDHRVQFYLDRYFQGRTISAHPNENTATVFLKADTLMELLQMDGHSVRWISMESENL